MLGLREKRKREEKENRREGGRLQREPWGFPAKNACLPSPSPRTLPLCRVPAGSVAAPVQWLLVGSVRLCSCAALWLLLPPLMVPAGGSAGTPGRLYPEPGN